MLTIRRITILTALGLLAALVGCGKSKHEAVPVKGTLYIDGKPFGPASISLQPEDAESGLPGAGGTVAKDGSFTLKTSEGAEGAVAGKYKVSISEDVMEAGNPIPVVEPASVEIKNPSDGGTVTLEIKLKSRKGAGPQAGPGTDDDKKPQSTAPGGI